MLAERLLASIASASYIVIPYSPASSWQLRFRSTYGRLTRELGIDQQAIARTVALLDEGNTVPFITRYRRDQTGGLDEEQIGRDPRERREAAATGGAQANDPRVDRIAARAHRRAARADRAGRQREAARRLVSALSAEEADARDEGPGARAQPARDRDPHPGQGGCRSRRPGGRLRQHG